ncbi:ComEC family competence protein [Sinirhodobacter sp. WL0062]|uniref:ComEC family competence protein n=1 Tax=Rhodobacter flavimaris TaxID=2907145 RepID=A0ABS8YTW9_9RHOB|nr:ComEC family competence protein [Sinirhodobacter sp. WL0062]
MGSDGAGHIGVSGARAWRLQGALAALARARADLALWAPVGLAVGIGLYFLWWGEPGDDARLTAWAVLAICVLLWWRASEAARFALGVLLCLAIGFLLAQARAQSLAAPVLGFRYYGPIEGRVVEIDRSGTDRLRITLDEVVLSNMAPDRTPARVRVSLHRNQPDFIPAPGLRAMLTGHLSPPPPPAEPGGYDFRRHAWFEQLGAVGYSRNPVVLVAPPVSEDWQLAGHRARMRLSASIQAQIPGQAGAVASALLTGDRAGISQATNEAMRAANLSHIISISGLHMGMVAGFVFAALRFGLACSGSLALLWPTKKMAAAGALVAATGYLWLAGPEIATERAYLMAAVMLAAVLFDRRALSLRSVAMAASVLLVLRPESLLTPGFQMSFAATVALIVTFEPWGRISPRIPTTLRPVAMLLLTSVVAGFATAPISAAHFNRMSAYGLIANLLAVPVMGSIVMPAGVVATLLAPLGLEGAALWVMGWGTRWMIWVAEWVAGFDQAVVAVATPPGWVMPLMGLGACIAILARGAGRGVGAGVVVAAFVGWGLAERPLLLIAPKGELVGLITPHGRSLSKPGASFIAQNWLDADGETLRPEEAATRPAFTGPKGAREAQLSDGRRLVHLMGKGAETRVAAHCHDGAMLILAARTQGAPSGCDLWDQNRLRETGALAIMPDGRLVTSYQVTGPRLWVGHPRETQAQ